MSWATALCALYDANDWRAGEIESWKNPYGKSESLVLLPLGYDTMKAHIEITIDEDGNFLSAQVVPKSEAETMVPHPERRTSGVKALPLCDSLVYVAGDFLEKVTMVFSNNISEDKKQKSIKRIKESFSKYITGLSEWCSSAYSTPKVEAVYKYIQRKSVIADLLNVKIIVPDDKGQLTEKLKIQGSAIDKAFVRFRVYSKKKQGETAVWLDKDVQYSFIKFHMSQAKTRDLCFVTGTRELSAKNHPGKIRGSWDKTSLISSNDNKNFTYGGRFLIKDEESDYNEALSIGYETSQKIHNALKWIIRRQGFTHDGVCLVTWETNLKELPCFYKSSLSVVEDFQTGKRQNTDGSGISYDEEEEENTDTNYVTARDFNMAMDGYAKTVDDTSQMVILALDSASPGRLAMTYFRELASSTYLDNIRNWQKSCSWRQEYERNDKNQSKNKGTTIHHYEGIGSIEDIAKAVYGIEYKKRLTLRSNSAGKSPMMVAAFDRLRPCIIDKAPVPLDIVRMAVMKASNPVVYESGSNYLRVLHTACSLVKKYYWEKGVVFDMVLDEKCTNRSYLFGRLLAVAEKIERSTYDKDETRISNAERYMRQFSQTPFRTWELIRRNTQIYLNKMKPGSREFYKNLYGTIDGQFEEGDFESKKVLDGRFLLGYDCQREALENRKKATDKTENDNSDTEGI
jgi:CRISPR-associated protein Csd1